MLVAGGSDADNEFLVGEVEPERVGECFLGALEPGGERFGRVAIRELNHTVCLS
jgi:hypothetical protein